MLADTLYSAYTITPESPIKEALRSPSHPLNIDDLDFLDMVHDDLNPNSPGTFIKNEPDDGHFDQTHFGQNGFQGGQHTFGHPDFNGVNPNDLTMGQNFMSNSFNMNSSYVAGASGITDDELLGSLTTDELSGQNMHSNFNTNPHERMIGQTNGGQQMYQSDNAAMQSPFERSFDYSQFQGVGVQQQQQQQHSFTAPMQQNMLGGYPMSAPARAAAAKLHRQPSDSRSPITPKTPAIGGLHLGTPESGSFPIGMGHRAHHQKNISGGWGQEDGTPNSGFSFLDSPLSSPAGANLHHAQIHEVLKTGKHASLPAKVDGNGIASQELKKKRRRESHNAVERRRRDNINERIQDLSRLVPQHRLEDEKVRKHINNNGPLSPTLAASTFGASPPNAATSLLAGGNGRRATSSGAGNITTGLPIEEKDKGPNKGDILNGAVSWMHDLMWLSTIHTSREKQLRQMLENLGGQWPFEESEEEKRMRSELSDAVGKSGSEHFHYTRGPGSGLRVPRHTTFTGEALNGMGTPASLSPGVQSGGSGAGSGQQQYWMQNAQHGLKEEDEFGMDMG